MPVAVVDIGSNSGRGVVYAVGPHGQLRILASSRASLRLVRDVDHGHVLGPDAVARVLDALADFRAIALGAGARRILAVATAAVRDAENGAALIERARRRYGIRIRLLSGREEALYGFVGAVRGIDVDRGTLCDLGGGSMQVSRFRDRRLGDACSLPLGALRLSDAFLRSDPPSRRQQRRLEDHVERALEDAGVAARGTGGALVGTGGTLRNLAKIDQQLRDYPLPRLHGYVLARDALDEIVDLVASRRARKRASIPGLNDDRVDSIVGGALAFRTLMRCLDADAIHVSGQGIREGLALGLTTARLPAPPLVRRASVVGLAEAFRAWDPTIAARRAAIADALLTGLYPQASAELREVLGHAATILDAGRSIDFFDRHEHAADIVLATDLLGFSHRETALLSAIVGNAGDEGSALARYEPLLDDDDRDAVDRAAALLALADDVEERCRDRARVSVRCRTTRRQARVIVRGLVGWRPRRIAARFARAFGRQLEVVAR